MYEVQSEDLASLLPTLPPALQAGGAVLVSYIQGGHWLVQGLTMECDFRSIISTFLLPLVPYGDVKKIQ